MVTNIESDSRFTEDTQDMESRISHMKCIKCPECGEPILMIPTLKEMLVAIDNHVSSHRKLSSEDRSLTLSAPFIRADLTEQVLLRAADFVETRCSVVPWL